MKLIQNRFCRKRFKIQARVKRWLGKKNIKKSQALLIWLLPIMVQVGCINFTYWHAPGKDTVMQLFDCAEIF